MANFVACDLSISLDGFVAGPNQSLAAPLGEGLEDRAHRWMFEDAANNGAELKAIVEHGAFVMGRNMFGPGRGAWDMEWRGWWGEDPPYHAPVFVLTHHPREPLVMQGGTTFTFVTDGFESALAQAKAAAGVGSVSIAGGAATARHYLGAGLVDELRLHIAPFVLGAGENLYDGLEALRLEPVGARHSAFVSHLRYRVIQG